MDWYVVVKTIKGRRYYYRQKTWREGKHVRTLSQYIGPAGSEEGRGSKPKVSPREPQVTPTTTADKSLDILMGEQAKDWDHAYNPRRDDPSIVKNDRAIDSVLNNLKVSWTHKAGGAYYNPRLEEVNIPPVRLFEDKGGQSATQAYYVVIFHELVHWTMGAKRLNRTTNNFNRFEYAREELVAELGATMLMRHFKLDLGNPGRHALYFQTWLSRTRNQKMALAYAKKHAEQAVRFILERGTMQHEQNS